ncbi:MAG: glycosyltransferase family 2 protein [Candidatus Omnitrophota bacterium]|nr:glycosyltransferase family 2 protein [Candidatus Omnitrophota bacterium]
MKNLSVVIPVYNEENSILSLYQSLKNNLRFTKDYEIIFVNDGSTDNTLKNLRRIKDKSVKIINFDKNLGQSAALTTGFHAAIGKKVITMDGDLQNDPSDIKNLLSKLDQGYDVVCGWRHERKDPFIIKRLPSRLFNMAIGVLFGVGIHDTSCTLRAYRKGAAKALCCLKPGYHRFIPVLLSMKGFRVGETRVKHNARLHGRAKYNSPLRFFEGMVTLVKIKMSCC